MAEDTGSFSDALAEVVRNHVQGATGISGIKRLSGGANQETWALDAETENGAVAMILRRACGGDAPGGTGVMHVSLETEAKLLGLAEEAGVPVPHVRYVLQPDDGLGRGFIMDRVEGETIARKILRDDAYAEARPKLARQCGEILARIHAISTTDLRALAIMPAAAQLEQYRQTYDRYDYPHPVFELAFRWLEERTPATTKPALVHGDFRNGNLIVGPDGVRAVLDWEIAHLGDPTEDLGWICVNSWRFGNIDKPVGGFGEREDLFAGYETASGVPVDPERAKFWEVFGTLKWGIMCMGMYNVYITGADPSVERAAIGRRSSETEIDLLRILE